MGLLLIASYRFVWSRCMGPGAGRCSALSGAWRSACCKVKPRSEARILSIVIYAVWAGLLLVAVKPLLAALGTAGFILAGHGRGDVHRGDYLLLDAMRHAHGI